MRSLPEIDADIAHIEYAKSILDEKFEALKTERNLLLDNDYSKDKSTKRLAEFFRQKGRLIVNIHSGERTKTHYSLAKQMWRSREVLLPFIKKLSSNKEKSFLYPFNNTNKTAIKNLCDVMVKQEWLTYVCNDEQFTITPTLKGTQKFFLSGAWAEEVTLYLLDKTLKEFSKTHSVGHKLFWDIQLKFAGSKKAGHHDMQLDLVAEVGDRFYIFEAKSGFVLSIDKWVDRTRLFDDDKTRFITCTADEKLNPLIFRPFRLFALPTLEDQFLEMLTNDFGEQTSTKVEK